ncbi:response regulator [Hahella sp. SMD15-11]|uniref:Response regulator n=1 Tax=Thermohahella caldifontis TaxID=3142973 RepID=A0AB39UYA0_9GAMM
MLKLLIVDDHDLVRAGLSRMLADENWLEVVASVGSGEEAIEYIRQGNPVDVVLMDVQMPGIGGIEATRRIKHINKDIAVVAVTACDDNPFPTRVMQAGASAFVTKGGASINEAIEAIRAVSRGQGFISPIIAQKMALASATGEKPENVFDRLSDREMQVAMMVVSGSKVQAISDKLCLSPRTVNTYRYRIFEKLGVESDVELTLLAMRHGLVDAAKVG